MIPIRCPHEFNGKKCGRLLLYAKEEKPDIEIKCPRCKKTVNPSKIK